MNITSATAYESFCQTFVDPAVGQEDVNNRAKLEQGATSATFSKNADDKIARWFNRSFSKPNATNSELKALSARFYQAVSRVFWNKGIPPSVLKALGVHNSSEGVMRPLSVRCIRRVAAAIERYNPRQPNKTNRQLSILANPRTSDVHRPTSTVRQSFEYIELRKQAVATLDRNLLSLKFQPPSAARSKGLVSAFSSSVKVFLFSSGHVNSLGDLSLLEDIFNGFESGFDDGAKKTVSPERFLHFLEQLKEVIQNSFGVNGEAAEKLLNDLGGKIMLMICETKSDTDAKPTEEEKTDKPNIEAKPTTTEKTDKSNTEVPSTKMKHFPTSGKAKPKAATAKTELDLPVITEESGEDDEDAPRLQEGTVHRQTPGSNTCFTWSLVNGMAASEKLRNHFESLIDREKGTIKVYTSAGRKELSLEDKQGVPEEDDAYICKRTQDPFERFIIRYCYQNDRDYQNDFLSKKQFGLLPMGNEAFMARTLGLVESRPQVRVVPDGKMETLELDSKTKSEDAEKMIRSQVNDGGLVIVNKNSIHFVSITGIDDTGKNISVADSLGSPKPTDSSFLTIQNNISQDQVADINSLVTLSFFDLPTAEGIDGAKEYVRNSLTFDSVSDYFLNAIVENQRQVSQAEKSLGRSYTISQARTKRNAEQDPERKKLLSTIVDSRLNIENYTSTLQLLVSDIKTFEAAKEEFVNNLGDSTGGRGEAARFVQLGGSETEEGRNHLDLCFKGFLSLKARELQK